MNKDKRSVKLNNEGFTLVEVLVAMAILAIISIPILSTFANSARINAKARVTENANTVCNNIIEEAKATTLENLNANKGTSFRYDYIGSDTTANLKVGGTALEYRVSTDGDGNFVGNNGEKYTVTARFDPTYYTDVIDNGRAGSDYNNINSSGVSIYNDISNSGSYVYRDESTDGLAVGALQASERISDFDVNHIQKTTNVEVNIAKIASASTVPTFVQVVTITAKYDYYEDLPSPTGTILDTYSRTSIYELNKITPHIVEEDVTDALGNSNKNTYYVVSSNAKYENNLKKVYIFYNPFDRAESYKTGSLTMSNLSEVNGQKIKFCNDIINIHYNYDNTIGVRYEEAEVYLIQQDVYYEKTDTSTKYKMELKGNNVHTSYAYGSIAYNGTINKLIYNGNAANTSASLTTGFSLGTDKTEIKNSNPVINQYLYANLLQLKSNNAKKSENNLMYRVTVTVKYRDKTIAQMTSTKIE